MKELSKFFAGFMAFLAIETTVFDYHMPKHCFGITAIICD